MLLLVPPQSTSTALCLCFYFITIIVYCYLLQLVYAVISCCMQTYTHSFEKSSIRTIYNSTDESHFHYYLLLTFEYISFRFMRFYFFFFFFLSSSSAFGIANAIFLFTKTFSIILSFARFAYEWLCAPIFFYLLSFLFSFERCICLWILRKHRQKQKSQAATHSPQRTWMYVCVCVCKLRKHIIFCLIRFTIEFHWMKNDDFSTVGALLLLLHPYTYTHIALTIRSFSLWLSLSSVLSIYQCCTFYKFTHSHCCVC